MLFKRYIVFFASGITSLSIPEVKNIPSTNGMISPQAPKTDSSPKMNGLSSTPAQAEVIEYTIHGENVTALCFEAYRSSFVKTMAVTGTVQALVQSTASIPSLKISGMAAAKAAVSAQQVFTKINEHMDAPLTDEDRAALLGARNEEVSVSVFIGLVMNNAQLLDGNQRAMLDKFQVVAQAERVSRLLVEQSCPELNGELTSRR